MHTAIGDTPADLADRLDRLAGELRAAGVLSDPAWQQALYAVPRHPFIPARAWIRRDGRLVELDRESAPQAWWDAVYAPDLPIVTQFDDGATGPDSLGSGPAQANSSCTASTIQFQLLHALDVHPGMRVLEIGTGTGWLAALLAYRLTDAAVTTIEIDPAIAHQARQALATIGRSPLVVAQDGRHGYPAAAPYDRLVATCAVHAIPYAWIDQTRPGGTIIVPWTPPASPGGGPLARLTVNPDGTATGPFVANVSFMPLRQQRRTQQPPPSALVSSMPVATARSTTSVHPIEVLFRSIDAAFPAQVALGGGHYSLAAGGRPEETIVWLTDPPHDSWARITSPVPFEIAAAPGTRFRVEQYGPRRLWDDLEAAYHWWQDAGRPTRLRFGLTTSPDEQVIWLDEPSRPVFRLPSAPPPALIGATS